MDVSIIDNRSWTGEALDVSIIDNCSWAGEALDVSSVQRRCFANLHFHRLQIYFPDDLKEKCNTPTTA